MSKVIKAMYVGELSAIFQPDLGVEARRNEPFSCPDEWLKARMAEDPERWKAAGPLDVEAWEKQIKQETADREKNIPKVVAREATEADKVAAAKKG